MADPVCGPLCSRLRVRGLSDARCAAQKEKCFGNEEPSDYCADGLSYMHQVRKSSSAANLFTTTRLVEFRPSGFAENAVLDLPEAIRRPIARIVPLCGDSPASFSLLRCLQGAQAS